MEVQSLLLITQRINNINLIYKSYSLVGQQFPDLSGNIGPIVTHSYPPGQGKAAIPPHIPVSGSPPFGQVTVGNNYTYINSQA